MIRVSNTGMFVMKWSKMLAMMPLINAGYRRQMNCQPRVLSAQVLRSLFVKIELLSAFTIKTGLNNNTGVFIAYCCCNTLNSANSVYRIQRTMQQCLL